MNPSQSNLRQSSKAEIRALWALFLFSLIAPGLFGAGLLLTVVIL